LTGAAFREGATLAFHDERSGRESSHACAFAVGADGAGSALRQAMNATRPLGERIEPLGHGYKELEIPSLRAEGRGPRAEERPLPRGTAGISATEFSSVPGSRGLPSALSPQPSRFA